LTTITHFSTWSHTDKDVGNEREYDEGKVMLLYIRSQRA
jgi:hypothetical protein